MYKFDFITDWKIIWSDDFQTKWLEWLENSEEPNIFFHPQFVKVWINTYLTIRDIKPLFCIAEDESGNIVFLPLVLWSKDWKSAFEKVIVPVGYSDYDYHDPIIFGDVNYDVFFSEFVSELSKYDYDEIIIDGINKKYINPKNWDEDEMSPFIDLTNLSSIDEYISSLKKNLRQDLRRRKKRLKENGDLVFKVFKNNEVEEALKELQTMQIHHTNNWPNAYKAPEYHNNLIKYLLPNNLLHFSIIALDEKVISWRIGFIYKNRYHSYMPAYDDSYHKLSPGKVHLTYCIEDSINMNLKIYDQLRGTELYKSEWTQNTRYLVKQNVENVSLSTKLKKIALNVKSKIK